MFNAFRVVLAEQAMAEAAEVERRLAAGELLTLAGVPIAIKDDTDVAGVSSMCGTRDRCGPGEQRQALRCGAFGTSAPPLVRGAGTNPRRGADIGVYAVHPAAELHRTTGNVDSGRESRPTACAKRSISRGDPTMGPTLISLAAQLESARPWAHHRPPAAGGPIRIGDHRVRFRRVRR